MRTRDTVCMCIFSFSSCIVSSWSLSGANAAREMLVEFNILSRDGCMLIDVGQFDTNTRTNNCRNSLQLPSLFLGCKMTTIKSPTFPKYAHHRF